MNEPIAIVGTACRFAGDVDSPSKLSKLLRNPRDVRTRIPDSRFCADGYYHPDGAHHGRSNVTHSYLINQDLGLFDAPFFNISSLEAHALDPQQRVLMEVVYEALEAAGQTIEGLRESDTCVFVGAMTSDWEALLLRDLDNAPTYSAVGTSRAILSNRIAHFFGWHGAAITVDTACSSSLVAVHQAVQALRTGDSHLAVACGTNLILGPENYIIESKLQMLSPDGLSRMWSKNANGYARGDGVAAIILKPLREAIRDRDSIECIIRETCLGQDGTTPSLTIPSAFAQQSLIESTYRKAGLDIAKQSDRPQYFEAHGTGTQAGDPIEAEAISKAFFNGMDGFPHNGSPLYVGSIKTVLGHTEGAAGIAAILKTSWALKNSIIPPNLLFEEINPTVAPFYTNLEITRSALPWPCLQGNQPRRASVNSFGFGGTNAHAILESYESDAPTSDNCNVTVFTPFVFSASSQKTLRANLRALIVFLEENDIAASDLAYTLREKRSIFSHRLALPSSPMEDLREAIQTLLLDQTSMIGIKALPRQSKPQILGIFTGQGAQAAGVGRSLVEKSPFAAQIIHRLDKYLAELSPEHRPRWSLHSEILAHRPSSMDQSEVSQPLCTAIQIMLVDLLKAAGVGFSAVVGHSSGEIAAAYASHHLSDRDAIYVAYYRGYCCKFSASPNGNIQGAMTAVATSIEDVTELCQDEEFINRVTIAASNSSSSVTISGDKDAIEELETILTDEGKSFRRLNVDQAYHSAHMLPCAQPYLQNLQELSIKSLLADSEQCKWYSSVQGGKVVGLDFPLTEQYWSDNMTQPVLFSEALETAASNETAFDVALEIGPHPALQVPASQTLDSIAKVSIPYHGTLFRYQDAISAFSTCLGFLWAHLGWRAPRLERLQTSLSPSSAPACFLKHLPPYQWDHEVRYWHESRRSQRIRLRSSPFHSLLGDPTPDSASHRLIWKNILKSRELDWLEGHQVEGQIVLPASAFISTAIEGAQLLVSGQQISLIEITDFEIHEAVVIDRDLGTEVLIELSHVTTSRPGRINALFSYSAALGGSKGDLTLAASGDVAILTGEYSLKLLPHRTPPPPHMTSVEPNRLYDFMAGLGYSFTGPFRSLSTLTRKLGLARCMAKRAECNGSESLLVHPVDLDAAIQSVALAYSYPGDDRLRYRHLPSSVGMIRINPAVLSLAKPSSLMEIDSTCHGGHAASNRRGFSGCIELYMDKHSHAAVQIDHVDFRPIMSGNVENRNVFQKTHWIPRLPDGQRAGKNIIFGPHDSELLEILTRIALFYLRKFDRDVPEDSPARTQTPLCHYLNYARHIASSSIAGQPRHTQDERSTDCRNKIDADIKNMGIVNLVDVKLMLLVGEAMPRVFIGATSMLEQLRDSNLLDDYYANGLCHRQSTLWLGQIVKQITDCHPHLKIIEIGAGTGGATKTFLRLVGSHFETYTFTDITSSFFVNATEIFAEWHERMEFRVFDVEKDPTEQGFVEGTYDVVIASLVLHATSDLDKTMRNVRKLIKPGGYLVVAEGSSDGPLQSGAGFIFGALPGWWLGVDEGRDLTPFVNSEHWDACLKRTGFSGIDVLPPSEFSDAFGLVLFVSRAVEMRIPPLTQDLGLEISKLTIIGGTTQVVAGLVTRLQSILHRAVGQINLFEDLETIDHDVVDDDTAIISFSELDSPLFQDLTPKRWYSFRKLWEAPRTLFWVTSGRLADQPFSSMLVGFARSAAHETEGLRLQLIDVPSAENIDIKYLATELIRCHIRQSDHADILDIREPEMVIDSDGTELVPRLMPIPAANDRYNSAHSSPSHRVSLCESVVELEPHEGGYRLRELSRFENARFSEDEETSELRVEYSTLPAIKTQLGHQFLVLGTDAGGNHFVSFSPEARSVLQTSREAIVPVNLSGLPGDQYLLFAAAHLLALTVIHPLARGTRLLVLNCPEVIAQAVSAQAATKRISVTFLTNLSTSSKASIYLPPFLRQSDLKRIVPLDAACFVDLTDECPEGEVQLASILPNGCHIHTSRTLYAQVGTRLGLSSHSAARNVLSEVLDNIQKASKSQLKSDIEAVSLEALLRDGRIQLQLRIARWATTDTLLARRTRLDSHELFRPGKTYWLCGMSGALGISLCDWMIDKGVRNLVITSRNPQIESQWVELHRDNGVRVEILSCDVTGFQALQAVHQRIVDTFPPIAGVVNGAMVLRDSSIGTMEFDQVMDVIEPKVKGSLNLDRIFYDLDLDFFILLSSINCVIGNVGQANYAAANMGVVGIAANRRKRGLKSIAVNAGAIIGIGYITQSDRQLDQVVERTSMMHLSDDDFHQIFAEAMEGCYLDSEVGPELSTGLLDIQPSAKNIPQWYSDPKFRHLVISQRVNEEENRERDKTTSVQEQLVSCQGKDEILLVVKKAFCAQLRRILHSSTADDELVAMRSGELGLDSLISVDLRRWVIKVFQVNIPVLRIMASETYMFELIETVSEEIPAEAIPDIAPGTNVLGTTGQVSINQLSSMNGKAKVENERAMPPSSKLITLSNDNDPPHRIDWLIESQMEDDIRILSSRPQAVAAQPKVVLLTGVSGLLGGHLLDHLLRQPSIERIICIAVRRLGERIRNGDIPPPEARIAYYEGDLRTDRLGLSELEAASIFDSCDAVIHNGADTSHLKYYTDVRDANVQSTRQILAYAIPRRIPVHYVSSAGVALLADLDAFPEISVTARGSLPPEDGVHGYMCSKWVCECLLEKANALYGLPVWIHRPSTIIREGNDATTRQAEFDWVNALIHYSHAIQAVPVVQHLRGGIDLVHVQNVCHDVVEGLLTATLDRSHEVIFVNNVGDIVIPLDKMADIGEERGKKYQELPLHEWSKKAIAAGLHPAVATLIEMIDEPGAQAYPSLLSRKRRDG